MTVKAFCLFLLGGLVACDAGMPDGDKATKGVDVTDDKAQVTGTLLYRERIAMPPGAVAEVWLLDTSVADMPAKEIAYRAIDDPGNPPIPFVLNYDPDEIREGMQYGIRATITHGGELLFTSDRHYPVLTRGAGNSADVLLIMVRRNR